MAYTCTKINEWIEEEVSKPIEEWEEGTAKKCKKRKWYDPRGWVCWLVTYLVRVVRWVLVKVGKWVVRTVCKIITALVNLIYNIFAGLLDVIVGIFTLDWRRILDGFIQIIGETLKSAISIGDIIFLGDTIDYIVSEVNKYRLRNYVRGLLEGRYEGKIPKGIEDSLRLDYGAFGLRINMTAIRTYLDSETTASGSGIPNIIELHEGKEINLKELAGFEFNEGFWNRKRYKIIKDGILISDVGLGELDNPISESELDDYISSRGLKGPKFIILSMRDKVLQTKLDAASEKARELGLMPNWSTKNVEVIEKKDIVHDGFNTSTASESLVDFLIRIAERTNINENEKSAIDENCNPVVVSVFRYTDNLHGIASCLEGSSCQDSHDASGVTFIDNHPDIVWKYVPIHEIGHYFGLCHVDGFDKIMYSAKQNEGLKWETLPKLLYLKGLEPSFTFDEAKQVWDYIIEHFSSECLGENSITVR